MKSLLSVSSDAPPQTWMLRLMAGSVFLWEGALKFVYTNQGVGRFTKLGFPFPGTTATLVGGFEIVGGVLLIVGLLSRPTALLFIGEMVVAMLSTKISLYLGTSPLPLPPAPPQSGLWAVLHEIRSEYAQLMVCAFIARVGPGVVSIDAWLGRRRSSSSAFDVPATHQPAHRTS
jgi:uncharacterized membrane protein YphA (DoxX/SURF4 family)